MVTIAASIYSVPVVATYSEKVRSSNYIWLMGIGCPAIADTIWIYLAKRLGNNQDIFFYSFSWEIVYKILVIAVPALFFGLRLAPISYAGLILIIAGGLLLKMGSGI